jgi:hypothetical protein
MAKVKLQLKEESEMALIAIVSSESDYRLCWAINRELNFGFKKEDDIRLIKNKKTKDTMEFAIYTFEQVEKYMTYHLVANRTFNTYLVPELKKVDYLLMIKGDVAEEEVAELVKRLLVINLVITAYKVDYNTLKSKTNLML